MTQAQDAWEKALAESVERFMNRRIHEVLDLEILRRTEDGDLEGPREVSASAKAAEACRMQRRVFVENTVGYEH